MPDAGLESNGVDEAAFSQMFGFSDFGTSKNRDHTEDAVESVYKEFN